MKLPFKTRSEIRSIVKAESSLNECIQIIYGPDDTKRSIERLLGVLCEYYRGTRAYIITYDEQRHAYDEIYEWCDSGVTAQLNSIQGIPEVVFNKFEKYLKSNKPMYVPDLSRIFEKRDLLYQIFEAAETNSIMVAPLMEKGKFVGFVGLDNPSDNEGAFFLLTSVAAFVFSEIIRSTHLERLMRLSYIDELTHAGNRHSYFEKIESINGSETPIGIAFADVNNLKKANDNLGHQAGDNLLLDVYKIFADYFPGDVYRIGGDEFVVLAPGIDEVVFEERMRAIKAKWTEDISASTGWLWSSSCHDLETLIDEADHRMYIVKEKHRLSKKE